MKITKVLLAVVTVFCAHAASAGKVVVFDIQQAIMGTDYAKSVQQKLREKPEYAKLIAEIEASQAELKDLDKEATSKGLTWSPEQKEENKKKMGYLQADLQLAIKKIQKENEGAMQGLFSEAESKLKVVIDQLVKSEGIDMILRKEAAVFASPAVDITPKLISELNKQFQAAE